MRHNGLPMTLQTFKSPQPVESTLAYYAHWWSSTEVGSRGVSRIVRRGDWQILALTAPQVHITIRAKPAGAGSEGDLAVSRNPMTTQLSIATAFPHPRTARVVNLQEYEDPSGDAEHISLISSRAASIEAHEFTELLTRKGWSVYREQPAQALAQGQVLEVQKGGHLAQLTFQPRAHSGSYIVVIWRKA